jgi:hypothetical protein
MPVGSEKIQVGHCYTGSIEDNREAVTIKVLDIVAGPKRIQDQLFSPRRRRFRLPNSTVHWAWRRFPQDSWMGGRPMPIAGFALRVFSEAPCEA